MTMKFNTLLLILVLMFSVLGCRSKKNTVESEKERLKIALSLESEKAVEKDIKIHNTTNSGYKEYTSENKESFEFKTENDSTEVIIEREVEGNKTTWRTWGIKDGKITNEEKTKSKQDTTIVDNIKIDKSKETDKSKIDVDLEIDSKNKKTNREASGVSGLVGVGIGIGIIALILLLYLNRKKRVFQRVRSFLGFKSVE